MLQQTKQHQVLSSLAAQYPQCAINGYDIRRRQLFLATDGYRLKLGCLGYRTDLHARIPVAVGLGLGLTNHQKPKIGNGPCFCFIFERTQYHQTRVQILQHFKTTPKTMILVSFGKVRVIGRVRAI